MSSLRLRSDINDNVSAAPLVPAPLKVSLLTRRIAAGSAGAKSALPRFALAVLGWKLESQLRRPRAARSGPATCPRAHQAGQKVLSGEASVEWPRLMQKSERCARRLVWQRGTAI